MINTNMSHMSLYSKPEKFDMKNNIFVNPLINNPAII